MRLRCVTPHIKGFLERQRALLRELLSLSPLELAHLPQREPLLITGCCRSLAFSADMERGDICLACGRYTELREAQPNELHLIGLEQHRTTQWKQPR